MPDASDNPRVSVIVTTHNRAALLPRAVDSVLAQDFHDYELIVVDDRSTDDTPGVIGAFDDPRIRAVRHAENKGQSASVNTGIWTARGEYLAFLDDDDEWTERKLSRQVRALDDAGPDVALAYTWYDRVDPGGERRAGGRSVVSGDISEHMLGWEIPAPTSTYMVRASAAREAGGYDEALSYANDRDFLCRVAERWRVASVPEVLMLMHGGHARSEQWSGASEKQAAYVASHVARHERELRERPRVYARLLRVLAIAEMRRGNVRAAARAYSKALAVDTRGTLRATVTHVGFAAGLLWRDVRRRLG